MGWVEYMCGNKQYSGREGRKLGRPFSQHKFYNQRLGGKELQRYDIFLYLADYNIFSIES